jgi:eukaryotic-like serine/threonine-protein kinase
MSWCVEEGSRLGPYELIKRIGLGGMAEIYLAKTTGIGGFEKYLALKVIHPKFAEDQEFIDMLIDEAKIVVQLNHVNVGQIFDLGCIDDTYYIAMEFVDGRDLYQLLVRCAEDGVSIPFDIIAFVAKEIAAALQYAHTKTDRYGRPLNLIHRDVSPQNVLLSFDGQVKLVDFGIAKASQRRQETESGVIKGKFFYMSPEQAWGDPLDGRSDVFSCGICLYEMITGEMLYNEERALVLLDKVRKAIIPNLRQRRPDLPAALEEIVLKALARDRDERYSSAGALQAALASFLYGHWPSFSQQRVGQFLQENFVDQSIASPLPVAPVEPPTVPSPLMSDDPLMEVDDFDRTYGQSVIFALGDADIEAADEWSDEPPSQSQVDYEDGDVTMASSYDVDELLKPIDESTSSPSWGESGEHTELLDGSLFRGDNVSGMTSELTGSLRASDDPTSVFRAHDLAEPRVATTPSVSPDGRTSPNIPQADVEQTEADQVATQEILKPKRESEGTESAQPTPSVHPKTDLSSKPKPRTPSPLKVRKSRKETPGSENSNPSIIARFRAKLFTATGVTVMALLGLLIYAAVEYFPVLLEPEVTTAVLVIGSAPSGAMVYIDGQTTGKTTPTQIDGLEVGGQHEVKLQRDGYRSHVEKLEMTGLSNEKGVVEVRRQFFLQRARGTLEVISKPPQAEVYLDGRYIGDTPVLKRNIKRQKKQLFLLIRKSGFIEKKESLEWGQKTSIKLDVQLAPRQ